MRASNNTERFGCRAASISRRLTAIVPLCVFGLVGGCNGPNASQDMLAEQLRELNQEKAQLESQIEECKAENQQLKERVDVLTGLSADQRKLYNIERIEVGRFTNFYDKDDDGQKEKLIVYVQPIDEQGDIVKAAGSVEVQLWDLNEQANQALLGQWNLNPAQVQKRWVTTLLSNNYRLMFDIADKVEDFSKPLTVKVSFTHYLTGTVLQEQKVIEP